MNGLASHKAPSVSILHTVHLCLTAIDILYAFVKIHTQPNSIESERSMFNTCAITARALLVSVLSLAIYLQPALGQSNEIASAQKKYPWDTRPNKCFVSAETLAMPMCAARADWSNFSETSDRISTLFAREDYDLIARAEKEVGFSNAQFPSGEYFFDAWYVALRYFFEHKGTNGGEYIDSWSASRGKDGYIKLAQALIRYGEAWNARGSGFAGTVSKESWDLFYRKLEQADSLLDEASPNVKQMGPWYALKLQIAYLHPKLRHNRQELLLSASNAWPEYTRIYTIPMEFSHPKWGGSLELMDGVARFALDKTREKLGAAMYSIAYEYAFRGDPNLTLPNTKVDWSLMKQGFRDLESRQKGQPWIWRTFAGLACQMRDKEEARRLYGIYDRKRNPEAKEGDDACRQFAMSS